jgi:hypothetical protein
MDQEVMSEKGYGCFHQHLGIIVVGINLDAGPTPFTCKLEKLQGARTTYIAFHNLKSTMRAGNRCLFSRDLFLSLWPTEYDTSDGSFLTFSLPYNCQKSLNYFKMKYFKSFQKIVFHMAY